MNHSAKYNLMSCSCQTLATSRRGCIKLHHSDLPEDVHSITFQFNNITQWIPYEDLLSLEWTVRNIDVQAYFDIYPQEDRIHLKTALPNLFFSFLPDELIELRNLLTQALFQLHWRKAARKSVN